jgi:hypothetical protein
MIWVKEKRSREKMKDARAILLNLIDRHDVTTLALKKIHHSRSSCNLKSFVEAIEKLAKEKG